MYIVVVHTTTPRTSPPTPPHHFKPPNSLLVFLSILAHIHQSKMASVDSILSNKYPAKSHARRVAEIIRTRHGLVGAIYLEAQRTRLIEDNDEPMPFRYVDIFPD